MKTTKCKRLYEERQEKEMENKIIRKYCTVIRSIIDIDFFSFLLVLHKEQEDVLERVYYDLDRGYGSARSLYAEANKDGAGGSLNYVKDCV